ncbi:MAG: aminotransferase class IV family protein [Campylobacterota bacterium]|nr:aminotransferase class IV family protein [Campylobacterota bacterium]
MSKKYLETIKAVNGEVYNLEYHQRRLENTLEGSKKHTLLQSLKPPSRGLFRCRVVYDKESLNVEYLNYSKRQVKTLKIVYSDDIEYPKKYENRDAIGELFALRGNCDDILIVKGGLVTDTSIANVAFYDGKRWLTPKRPLLYGTTRERYLKDDLLVEADIFVDDIREFTKVALMNAIIDFDIIPLNNIEDIIC